LREFKNTAVLALATSLPITLVCGLFSWTLIHSQDSTQHIAAVLLAPALGLIFVWSHLGLNDTPYLFIPLVLFTQFSGYFILIHLVRRLAHWVRGAKA
jgi:amino acid permease